MSASERLRELGAAAVDALEELSGDAGWAHAYQPGGEDAPDREPEVKVVLAALPLIADVVEAAERGAQAVELIRALGFVGNAHYCPDCMNHFHEDRGQHEPGCSVLTDLLEEGGWWERDDSALTALREHLEGGDEGV